MPAGPSCDSASPSWNHVGLECLQVHHSILQRSSCHNSYVGLKCLLVHHYILLVLYTIIGSPTKCQSNKRRMYKTSNDKTSKDKTSNGTKHRMEKTPNGTKRRMELTPNGTKGRMEQNVEWKKHWMEKTPNRTKRRMEKRRMGQKVECKNTEWDKTSNGKNAECEKTSTGNNVHVHVHVPVRVRVHGHGHGQGHGRGCGHCGRFLQLNSFFSSKKIFILNTYISLLSTVSYHSRWCLNSFFKKVI